MRNESWNRNIERGSIMIDKYEANKLADVKELILAQINTLGASLATKRAEVLETREEMWREARIVLRDFDDVADLTGFAEDLARHERQYADTSKRLTILKKMLDSPYFARIDFTEEDEDYGHSESEKEEVYIGRNSLFDDKTQSFYVYDWRAPISSLYYDYGVGAASFTVPATKAKIAGQITLKRQYQIEKSELLYMFDNDLAIDDDILRRELSKSSDAHIKTIINTIQHEQNKAIRAEADHVLVYGPAGSGKTSVGLHRLAYLLYRHRESLTSARVRIFSPSPIFASYIAGIIPELGEDDVTNLDFPTLLEMNKGRAFYGPYHQIEHLSKHEGDMRSKWLAHKYQRDFLNQLEKAVAEYVPSFEDVIFVNDCLCTAEKLDDLYKDRTSVSNLALKTNRVLNYVNQAYAEYFDKNERAITTFFENLYDDTFSEAEIRAKFEAEKQIVILDLNNRLKPSAQKIYARHLQKWAKKSNLSAKFARDALNMEKLYYEDALALFYVNLLIGRIPQDKGVKHILIDEAQDMSLLHHKILNRLYPTSHFTILADVNQALYPEINITNTDDLAGLYPKATRIPLTKSYRSTYEISNFATKILSDSNDEVDPIEKKATPSLSEGSVAGLRPAERRGVGGRAPIGDGNCESNFLAKNEAFFARHGDEPEIITTSNAVKTTLEIVNKLPKDYNTVAILFSNTSEAEQFYTELQKVYPNNATLPLNFIASDSHEFIPSVMVMSVPFAKGLEFDAVICPEYGKLSNNTKLKKLLYLMCTRALHRLYCFK